LSDRFQPFLSKWDVKHITSSPKYPQSNGEAERAVQTVKGLMKKNVNIQAALCAHRDTPLATGYSPAELMFGRSLNSMGVMPNKSVNLSRLGSLRRVNGRYKRSIITGGIGLEKGNQWK